MAPPDPLQGNESRAPDAFLRRFRDLERRLASQAQVAGVLAAESAELRSAADLLLDGQQTPDSFLQELSSKDVQPHVPTPSVVGVPDAWKLPENSVSRSPVTPICTSLPMVSFDIPASRQSTPADAEGKKCLKEPAEKPFTPTTKPAKVLQAWSGGDLDKEPSSPSTKSIRTPKEKKKQRRSSITELVRTQVFRPTFRKSKEPEKKLAPPTGGKVFTDVDTQMEKMQAEATRDTEDSYVFYHETGICQAIVRNPGFDAVSFLMVCFSSVWIAVEIDFVVAGETPFVFAFMAQLFCVYFSMELVVQFFAFREKRRAILDRAFLFDTCLVFLIVLETWVLGLVEAIAGSELDTGGGMSAVIVFRILRVLKVLRLGRVLRQLPELLVVVRGIASAFKAIFIIVFLLALIIYVAGIFFRVILEGTELGESRFRNVPMAMGTLLIEGTLSGNKGGPVLREAQAESTLFAALLLTYVLLANVTVMGILGGILVRTVATVADLEKAESEFTCISHTLNEIWDLYYEEFDTDNDGHMSLAEFQAFMKSQHTIDMLKMHNIDLQSLQDCSAFLFENYGGQMSKPEFKRCVLDHRGKMAAKVKDHVETRRYVHSFLQKLLPDLASEVSSRATAFSSDLQMLRATAFGSSDVVRFCNSSELQLLKSSAAGPSVLD